MENDIVALKCPNCGSNDVVAESETAAVCRRCGGRFVMQKQQGPVYVKNEIFMGGGSGYTKKNMTFPVVNDAVSFKRAAIVNLMKDERTPVDLLDAEFAPVGTDVNQFLAVEADVDTTYSAMVGTDHFENRIQYSKNMMGETVAKQVTVTVTDWQPFNGMKRCSETGVIALKTKGDERDEIDSFVSFAESEAFSEAIPAEEESANLEEPIVPTDKQIQSARLCAEEAAKQECRRDLPGDHYKDFRATAVSTIRSSVVYLVPEHTLEYTYGGEKFQVCGFSCEKDCVYDKLPKNSEGAKTELRRKSKKLGIAALIFDILLCLVSLSGLLFIFREINIAIKAAVLGPLFLVAFILFSLYKSVRRKSYNNIAARLKETKLEKLKRYLDENNYSPLSEEEKNSDCECRFKDNSNVRAFSAEMLSHDALNNSNRVLFIVGTVLFVIALLF